jgi:lysophospholipid acyltransferase (LPLAT)-like uncharacterized protein
LTAPEPTNEHKKERKVSWAVRLGRPLLTVLGWTWRIEEVNADAWKSLVKSGKPYILSSWHGQLLAHIWANRFRNISAMVSEHGDGEIISRIMSNWGYRTVRGSSSRGGKRALLEMVDDLVAGKAFAITPDGPRGPAGTPAAGILVASSRSGVAIVPMRSEASRSWRLKSWDRFEIPKPFAKVRVYYGEPWVAPNADAEATAELVRRMGPAHATLMPAVVRK